MEVGRAGPKRSALTNIRTTGVDRRRSCHVEHATGGDNCGDSGVGRRVGADGRAIGPLGASKTSTAVKAQERTLTAIQEGAAAASKGTVAEIR